jgi:hypothetical protein
MNAPPYGEIENYKGRRFAPSPRSSRSVLISLWMSIIFDYGASPDELRRPE